MVAALQYVLLFAIISVGDPCLRRGLDGRNARALRVQRGGFRAVLIGRLIPGLRVAMSLVAGTAHEPVPQFSAGVFVAGVIYWTGWVLLGALLGPSIEDLVALSYAVFRLLRGRRKRRRAQRTERPAAALLAGHP